MYCLPKVEYCLVSIVGFPNSKSESCNSNLLSNDPPRYLLGKDLYKDLYYFISVSCILSLGNAVWGTKGNIAIKKVATCTAGGLFV